VNTVVLDPAWVHSSVSAAQPMRPNFASLLPAAMVLLLGCSSVGDSRPEMHGRLSVQDFADVQAQLRETSTKAILWIKESGEKIEAYTGDRRGGGIVYLFQRNKAGRLEGCGSGWWD
jgi:hypothetical protein